MVFGDLSPALSIIIPFFIKGVLVIETNIASCIGIPVKYPEGAKRLRMQWGRLNEVKEKLRIEGKVYILPISNKVND